MNVKQLIEKLSTLNPDATVYLSGPDCGGYDTTWCVNAGILSDPKQDVVFIEGKGEIYETVPSDYEAILDLWTDLKEEQIANEC